MAHAGRAALCVLMAAGCAGSTTASAPKEAAPSAPVAAAKTFVLDDHDVAEILRDTSAARQLAPTKPIPVVRLDRRSFVEHLLAGRHSTTLTPDAAFLVGFDFVPQPGKRGGVARIEDVLAEQVVGFYDRADGKVFIPDVHLRTEDELFEQEAVLAHEAQHALQAQHFPRAPAAQSSDESLAQLALTEGDAQVAMGAWVGARAGAPVGRSLRRIVEVTKRVPLASVTRGEEDRTLDKALGLTRKRLEFPYRDGMLFVADVYRAGGFPLIDKVYESPPRSTAQILHPEKYLAGEVPRPVADPRPPPGYTLSTAGTLGELDTRVLLERCLDAETAARAAAGWAGDRYGVFAGPEHRLATAWVSAWDTEQDAREAEAALQKSAACWHDNALGVAQRDLTIGAAIQVRREGKLVTFLRGFPATEQAALEPQLFALVGPEPKPRPVSDLKIPPRVSLPEPRHGHLEGDVYRNEWIGVVGRAPPGMIARAGGLIDFEVERTDVLVRGSLSISTRITSDAENEKTFREAQEAFVAKAAEVHVGVEALGGGPVKTALGAGIDRRWRVAGTAVELRILLIPICAGTGSLVFVQVYGDAYARSVLDGWVESFRWTHGRNLTACDFLDPK